MYYFIGIKGSGMASLARILYDLGYEVAGSDIDKYIFLEDGLRERHIPIYSFNSVGSVLSFYGENHHWRHLRINENDIVFSDGKINTSTETRSAVPMKIIGIK